MKVINNFKSFSLDKRKELLNSKENIFIKVKNNIHIFENANIKNTIFMGVGRSSPTINFYNNYHENYENVKLANLKVKCSYYNDFMGEGTMTFKDSNNIDIIGCKNDIDIKFTKCNGINILNNNNRGLKINECINFEVWRSDTLYIKINNSIKVELSDIKITHLNNSTIGEHISINIKDSFTRMINMELKREESTVSTGKGININNSFTKMNNIDFINLHKVIDSNDGDIVLKNSKLKDCYRGLCLKDSTLKIENTKFNNNEFNLRSDDCEIKTKDCTPFILSEI